MPKSGTASAPDDPYFKKLIAFAYGGRTISFRAAQELFSSQAVDVGTQRLLRSLPGDLLARAGKVLDLGCGYGPLGLSLKAADPTRVVHLVDRDALAVTYTQANAVLNGLGGVQVYASLGYADVAEDAFDLIVSNVPGRAGPPVIERFLHGAAAYLHGDATVAVVVVTPLADLVSRALDSPDVEVRYLKEWPGHVVFHYGFATRDANAKTASDNPLDVEDYLRDRVEVKIGGIRSRIATAYGLPEFDRLDYLTELVLQTLATLSHRAGGRVAVLGPGQGYVPVILAKLFRPDAIALVDRDLLSLRVSRYNLLASGHPAAAIALHHEVGFSANGGSGPDLVVMLADPDEGPAVHAWKLQQIAATLPPDGTVLVGGTTTAVVRLESSLKAKKALRVASRARDKGKALLVLRAA